MFHHFHNAVHPKGQGAVSAEEFHRIIECVGRDRVLSAEDWLARAESGSLRDGDLCLTLDDGLRCQFDVALPVLRELGLTGFWFVYTSPLENVAERLEVYRYFRSTCFPSVDAFYRRFFECLRETNVADDIWAKIDGAEAEAYLGDYDYYTVADRRFRYVRDVVLPPEKFTEIVDGMIADAGLDVVELAQNLWMNEDQLRTLVAEDHILGLHSHSHPTRLDRIPIEQQRREYERNYHHISRLGPPPRTVAHPSGAYTTETLDLLRDMGIGVGFSDNMRQPTHSHLEFPRMNHAHFLAIIRNR